MCDVNLVISFPVSRNRNVFFTYPIIYFLRHTNTHTHRGETWVCVLDQPAIPGFWSIFQGVQGPVDVATLLCTGFHLWLSQRPNLLTHTPPSFIVDEPWSQWYWCVRIPAILESQSCNLQIYSHRPVEEEKGPFHRNRQDFIYWSLSQQSYKLGFYITLSINWYIQLWITV